MFLFPAQHITDGYKLDHISQYVPGTEYVTANMTPRSDKLANVIREYHNGKVVFMGIQQAIQHLKELWDATFFSQPKEVVIAKFARRLHAYVGSDKGVRQIAAMGELHDLGYLPLSIRSLPEGARVNMQVPFYTITNTNPRFPWLVNYSETFISCMVWPLCNAASLAEQYWNASKRFAEITGAPDIWTKLANHCFAGRGHRGYQDAAMSGAAHLLFSIGTDTLWAIDFLEHYYDADATTELVACSVTAFEHATATQRIAYFGQESVALGNALTELYPTGIVSYVSDSKDHFGLLNTACTDLKDIILNRKPDAQGLVKTVFRPDSSLHTPLEVILGYTVFSRPFADVDSILITQDDVDQIDKECANAFDIGGTYYFFEIRDGRLLIDLDNPLDADMIKGSLQILADGFGYELNAKDFKVINPMVGLIYGEAISLKMQSKIYKRMVALGWCVSNVLFGVGSWAFLENSSRDSYGIAIKGTNSIVNGVPTPMQKNPKTSAAFKKSARGLLRVELEGDDYVLYDNQTTEQSLQGELREIWKDGVFLMRTNLTEIRTRLGFLV